MRVFFVHAHHEPTSFNGSLNRAALSDLEETGHDAVVSDLYAMGFDPVSDRRNFRTVADASRLVQQDEETHATVHEGYVAAIDAEWHKLRSCDALVLQFPLWWMGMPAILKGWIDRVFSRGRAYGGVPICSSVTASGFARWNMHPGCHCSTFPNTRAWCDGPMRSRRIGVRCRTMRRTTMPKRKTTRRSPIDVPVAAADTKAQAPAELTPAQLAGLAAAGQISPEALWRSAGRFRRLR